jgi:prevent-host-death family protein
MNISIQQLKSNLSHYLRLANQGETVVVTSHDRPLAKIESCSETAKDFQDIPLVEWARGKPRLTLSVVKSPIIEDESLSDWIVSNHG